MESYWCCRKKSSVDLSTGMISDLELVPCQGRECVVWREGKCGHVRKVGKIDLRQSIISITI
jgi:hypothetical protein